MKVRGEEHRALGDSLPSGLKTAAVRLNVAAREHGGKSVITSETVRELGTAGVRDVLAKSYGSPQRAALLVAEKTAQKVAERAVMPERDGRDR